MSIQAIAAAFKVQMEMPCLKFILICFANYATEYGTTYCSNSTLRAMTGMNEKTIAKWIKKLEADGFLVDTGKRQGDTGKIKVYNIVVFETHPKLGVLENDVIPPILGVLNTPNFGESPTPPIKINLKSKPKEKIYKKDSPKVSLAEWEEKMGAILCVEMLSSWMKDARATPDDVRPLVAEFRERVTAGGTLYADFRAAFQVWLRKGYLSKPLMAVQQRAQRDVSGKANLWTTGTQL